MGDAKRAKWVKGCESAHCLEVLIQKTQVKLRNSNDPNGPTLKISIEEWKQFRYGLEHGAFD